MSSPSSRKLFFRSVLCQSNRKQDRTKTETDIRSGYRGDRCGHRFGGGFGKCIDICAEKKNTECSMRNRLCCGNVGEKRVERNAGDVGLACGVQRRAKALSGLRVVELDRSFGPGAKAACQG